MEMTRIQARIRLSFFFFFFFGSVDYRATSRLCTKTHGLRKTTVIMGREAGSGIRGGVWYSDWESGTRDGARTVYGTVEL
jgi:hypothetical protein